MWRNPISDKRKPFIKQAIVKHLVKRHKKRYSLSPYTIRDGSNKPEGKLHSREKVGPFRLSVYHRTDDIGSLYELRGPVRESGFVHRQLDRIEEMLEQARAGLEQTLLAIDFRAKDLLDLIEISDPTPSGEYAAWIAQQSLEKHINLSEDVEKVREDLESFHNLKTRGIIPPTNRDINGYETYGNFFETLQAFGGVLSDRQRMLQALESGKQVYSNATYRVIEVREWQLAKKLASGTAWCVRGTGMAKHYLQKPDRYPLYFFFKGEEQYALLTNLPKEKQFRDTRDVSISDHTLKTDDDLRDAVSQFATWLICPGCETIRPKAVDLNRITAEIVRELYSSIAVTATNVSFQAGAFMVFEMPPDIINYPVIASNDVLANKIVIGPARAVVQQLGGRIRFPSIERFFDRAGYSSSRYSPNSSVATMLEPVIRVILEPHLCSCGQLMEGYDKQTIRDELLHVLYIIQPCEDFGMMPGGYVVCGHEISRKYGYPQTDGKPMGPCCPPRLSDYGPHVGNRCECGAFVPPGSRFSTCPACLEKTEYPDHDYPYDEPEGKYLIDDCPLARIHEEISADLYRFRVAAQTEWDFHYDPHHLTGYRRSQNLIWRGPEPKRFVTWSHFDSLIDVLYGNQEYYGGMQLSPTMRHMLSKHSEVLLGIHSQGWFNKQLLVEHLLPALEEIDAVALSEIKGGHPHCCKLGD